MGVGRERGGRVEGGSMDALIKTVLDYALC
jgi:hypothetical protein